MRFMILLLKNPLDDNIHRKEHMMDAPSFWLIALST